MKQRQCRNVAHLPSIFELVVDSYGSGKGEAPHDCAGLPNLLDELAVLLVLLAALLLLTGLRLAALLLLTGLLLATLLLATLLLLAGLLVWILIHRSFLSNIGLPLRSLVSRGRSQSAGSAFVPRSTLRQSVWNLFPHVEFLPQQGGPTMGRYMLLWLLGVPIPILVLIWLFGGLH